MYGLVLGKTITAAQVQEDSMLDTFVYVCMFVLGMELRFLLMLEKHSIAKLYLEPSSVHFCTVTTFEGESVTLCQVSFDSWRDKGS